MLHSTVSYFRRLQNIKLKTTAILILAAGEASRMGEIKQNLPYLETTLLGHAITQAKQTKAQHVYCVLGAQKEAIKAEIKQEVSFITNEAWEEGLGASISIGVKELRSKKYNHLLIMLADQPLMTAAYLNKLIDKAKEHPETCVASAYKNKKGVPAIFPESYFDALEKLSGDQGAKALLNSDRSVIALNAEDLLQDIDTPEDYECLLKK